MTATEEYYRRTTEGEGTTILEDELYAEAKHAEELLGKYAQLNAYHEDFEDEVYRVVDAYIQGNALDHVLYSLLDEIEDRQGARQAKESWE